MESVILDADLHTMVPEQYGRTRFVIPRRAERQRRYFPWCYLDAKREIEEEEEEEEEEEFMV